MVYGRSLSDPYGDPGSLLHGVSIIVRYHRGGTSLRAVVYYYHSSILSDTGVLNVFYFTLRSGGKTVITFCLTACFTWVVSVILVFAFVQLYGTSGAGGIRIGAVCGSGQGGSWTYSGEKGVWITNLVVN